MSASAGGRRIGVTGHRAFLHHADVESSIDSVLDRVLPAESTESGDGADPRPPEIVTSLAEGADRLVARMVLARGGTMRVILPLDATDYATDFATAGSRAEFDALLAQADSIEISTPSDASREGAHEAAGHAMVAASDVVIALWDGAPARGRGGTAQIVQHALERNVVVEIVLVER